MGKTRPAKRLTRLELANAAGTFAGVAGWLLRRLRMGLRVHPLELRRLRERYDEACRVLGVPEEKT